MGGEVRTVQRAVMAHAVLMALTVLVALRRMALTRRLTRRLTRSLTDPM